MAGVGCGLAITINLTIDFLKKKGNSLERSTPSNNTFQEVRKEIKNV